MSLESVMRINELQVEKMTATRRNSLLCLRNYKYLQPRARIEAEQTIKMFLIKDFVLTNF